MGEQARRMQCGSSGGGANNVDAKIIAQLHDAAEHTCGIREQTASAAHPSTSNQMSSSDEMCKRT